MISFMFVDTCEETCELERKKKGNDNKRQKKSVNTISLSVEESRAFSQKTGTLSDHPGMAETLSETNAKS